MLSLKKHLGTEDIKIIPLADAHAGDSGSALDLLRATIKEIETTPNTYTFINGDFLNMALKDSVSFRYGEMPPNQEFDLAYSLLKPIAHKILFMQPGNHERRLTRSAGIDLLELLANSLNIPYSPSSTLFTVYLGTMKKIAYVIYAHHGARSGGTIGGKANALQSLSSIVDNADIYVHSHTHEPIIFSDAVFRVNRTCGSVSKITRYFINTNGFLGYKDTYAEHMALKPSSDCIASIGLSANERKISVWLS